MKPFLTEISAQKRSLKQLSKLKYDLFFNFDQGPSYSGLCNYEFKTEKKFGLFMDFTGKTISKFILNGNQLTPDDIKFIRKDGFINLPKEELSQKHLNKMTIGFENDYYNDGNGIHSFTDIDGRQYIYTQSEPYWTNRIFPLFDQPDIKGRYTLRALVPEKWTLIANSHLIDRGTIHKFMHSDLKDELDVEIHKMLIENQLLGHEKNYAMFSQTPSIPSYLFGFAAGEFNKITSPHAHPSFGELNIYCRKSLTEFAEQQKDQIFSYCNNSISHYNKFFQVEYPFHKCDLVFCPEYTVGAMEYPGIITFNDRYLFREKPNSAQVSHRGETIVHELAHMWFGNYVTMKWWNDLWLNEAFASWVSYEVNSKTNHLHNFSTIDSWVSFQLQKFRAYNEDQEPTTHPIACPVVSSDKADAIFDAITYCKGASALKQLYFILGNDLFSDNIGSYFKQHKWSNAQLTDFIDQMSQKTEALNLPLTLHHWNKTWIETAGLNEVEASWTKSDNGQIELKLTQTAVLPEHPTLRFHKMKLAFFDESMNVVEVREIWLKNEPVTTILLDNIQFESVLPNYEDWSFIKIKLDQQSKNHFVQSFNLLTDPQSKLLVIRSFFESVRDGHMAPQEFVSFILEKVIDQNLATNDILYDTVFSLAAEAILRFSPKNIKLKLAEKTFDHLHEFLKIDDKMVQKSTIKKLLSMALTPKTIKKLLPEFKRNLNAPDRIFGINDLWNYVCKYNTLKKETPEDKKAMFEKMKSIDNSDLCKYSELHIQTYNASLEERKELMAKLIDPQNKISYGDLEHYLSGFFSFFADQELKEPFWEPFFENLPSVIKNFNKSYARVFLSGAYPDSKNLYWMVGKSRKTLRALEKNDEYFKVSIQKIIFNLKRKIKTFKCANDYQKAQRQNKDK